ncbi:hypothetical protein E1B28_007248 [Marasmius oreades]|uniref:Cytochrome P450 n=1 Tax=Marasmius oreades TaxID=181124 RepID=A0A9P7S1G0_9AGAR|nr:uncharacterized protein E1B28_007248 [Marasmius oreades]KAG7093582.1 hypothetical protein E1B28_007248 [Marasmius oreades]
MNTLSFTGAILVLVGLYAYHVSASDKRLDKYPGPFIARWTTLYKKYFETIMHGAWVDEVERLHRLYGPIVRVGPKELHFSNPDAYNDIYAVGSRFAKDPDTYSAVTSFLHLFGVLDPQEALTRRTMIQPYFSKRSVSDRTWLVQQKVDQYLDELLLKHAKDKVPVDLEYALRPFFSTTIATFAFPDLEQCHALTTSGLASTVTDTPDRNTIWFLMKNLHPVVVKILTSTTTRISLKEMDALEILAADALQSFPSDVEETNANFFHILLKRSQFKRPPNPRKWLASEALNLKFAGVDTTANPVFFAIRGVLGSHKIWDKLTNELYDAWPDLEGPAPDLVTLEKLPYLTAVIKEGLRLSIGVITPMNRVVGEDTIVAGEYIPARTVIGMSNSFMHLHPDIFPEPHVFKPERWLQENSQKLDKYLVVFSRGPRSCVGMHFAWCMMYLLLANMFRKLEIYPTSADDLRAPFHLRDDFVSVFVGKSVHLHFERKQN